MKQLNFIKFVKSGLLILGCLFISSCSSLFPSAGQKRIFVLGSGAVDYCALPAETDRTLILSEDGSAPVFGNNKIMFQKASELGFYQMSEWSEPVVDRIDRLMEEKMRCRGFYVSRQAEGSGNADAIRIRFTVLDFSHKAQTSPGVLDLKIRIERLSAGSRAERIFQYSQILGSYDVDGVIGAADQLISQFLADFVPFVEAGSASQVSAAQKPASARRVAAQ